MLEYKYLRAYVLTVKHASFTKAAKELQIAQSAVSRQIRLLEESTNEQLLIRSSRKLILTPLGKELYRTINRFDSHLKTLFEKQVSREIRIGTLHGVLETWLVDIIATFARVEKNDVSVHVDSPDILIQGIEDGVYDFVFTNENIQHDILSSVKLFDEEWVLVSHQPVAVDEIARYPWIVYANDDFLMTHFSFQSQQIVRINSMTSILKLVKEGVGIAVVPSHMLYADQSLYKLSMSNGDASSVYITMLNYERMPTYLKQFYSFITEKRKK